MHETKEKTKKLCEMKEKIQNYMDMVMCSDLSDKMSVEQAGQFIDMIKDLYEAEKDAWKACYYKKMVEGMEPMSEEDRKKYKDGPFGYDNWRYSSVRFAPTGHGHFAGYMEEPYMPEYMNEDMRYGDISGYSSSGRGRSGDSSSSSDSSSRSSSQSGSYGYNGMNDSRYGRAYNEWRNSRRHYTETNDKHDKEEMDMHAKESLMDATASMRELWKAGDPELRKHIKQTLQSLIQEMPA